MGLRGGLTLHRNELVAELFGLAFNLVFESLLALGIAGGPDALVIFELFGDHGVEDDGDLMSGGGGGC